MDTRDDEVVFRDAVKSIIEVIKKFEKTQNYFYLTPKIDLINHVWYLELQSKTRYPHLYEFKDELMKLEPVRKCVSLMLERNFPKHLEMEIVDKDGKPVENPNYEPFLIAEILGTLTHSYLERYGLKFEEEKFRELYNEMTKYVYSSYRELVIVAPLENFELKNMEGKELVIGEYKVRKLTEWEMTTLLNFGYKLGVIFTPDHGNIETFYCVERTIKTQKRSTPALQPYLEDFITILRLLKAGIIGTGALLHYPKIWKTSWGASFSHEGPYRGFPKYTLEQVEVQPLTNLLEKFSRVKHQFPENIKFSLRWFNKSYNEREILDKLLDLAIALEILFGRGDRLDLYVPAFIGSSKEEKLKISKDLERLQNIRGAIVHSGSYKKGVTQEYINSIENYYRWSMCKFLDLLLTSSYESILRNIKASFLNE